MNKFTLNIIRKLQLASKFSVLSLAFLSSYSSAKNDTGISTPLKLCVSCHGEKGFSNIEGVPNLAGQKMGYLTQEIKKLRDSVRYDPIVTPLLKGITDEQSDQLAMHFANLVNTTPASKTENMAGKHVRARCIACHGMSGITVNELWPNLAGQNKKYLEKQLLDFKSGKRTSPIMQVIASELNEQQIKDVAEYFSQQAAHP